MKSLTDDILMELETLDTLPVLRLDPGAMLEDDNLIEDTLMVTENFNMPKPNLDDGLWNQLIHIPVHEIHQRVRHDIRVTEDFVDKLVAFHLGHFSLSVDDLMDYFVHLDRVFAHFAHHCPGFHDLTPNDQSLLLMSNSSLYFQLHLAQYTNAGNGLDQVKSLLGQSIPEDLVNCDKFLTISFKYFASALRLFSEEVWLETYIHYASILKENPLTFDEMAACILFMNPQAPCEEPEKIQKLGNQVLSQISSKQSVRSAMMSLKAMTQFYSHGSTSNFFGDSFIDNTEASFSSMPSFKASDEEEIFWLERQLKKCQESTKYSVNVGTDVINDVVLYFHNQIENLEEIIERKIVESLFQRCHVMLQNHHEFRKLSQRKNFSKVSDIIAKNVPKAVALMIAYIDMLEPKDQLEFLFGHFDSQLCPPLNDSLRKITIPKIDVLRHFLIDLDDLKVKSQWLKTLSNSAFVTPRHISLASLAILWETDLEIGHTHEFQSQIAAIRERYQMYLKHVLKKDFDSRIALNLVDRLILNAADVQNMSYNILTDEF